MGLLTTAVINDYGINGCAARPAIRGCNHAHNFYAGCIGRWLVRILGRDSRVDPVGSSQITLLPLVRGGTCKTSSGR